MNIQTPQTPQQLGKSLYSGLFATKADLPEAYNYAMQIAQASENPAAVMTAIQVLVNTIAVELMAMQPNNVRERNDE
jgi:hypothetical protein